MEDTLNYEIEENNSSSLLNRNDISSFNVERSVENIVKWFENGKIEIPDFQRGFVWKKTQSSKFVDSILFGLPVPNLFLFREIKDGTEKYLLIDGQQRIRTLDRYMHNRFYDKLSSTVQSDFKITYKSSRWAGCSITDLVDEDSENFKDYPLTLTIFELKTKDMHKGRIAMCEVFERINTGADNLSPQEIRHAVYAGKCLNLIRDNCGNLEFFKSLVSKDSKYENSNCRMKDEEFLLRLLAFNYLYTINKEKQDNFFFMYNSVGESIKIPSAKGTILNLYLDYSNEGTIDCNADMNIISKALGVIMAFDEDAFLIVNREGNALSNKIHEVFSEALVISVIANNFEIKISKVEFEKFKFEKWNTDEFYNLFVQDTISIKSVIRRVNYLRGIIENGSN